MAGEARQILAQNLRLLRFHRRWSQETLGFEAGSRSRLPASRDISASMHVIHRTYISQIEKGKSNISIDNIEKLAHALGLTVSELLRPPNGPPGPQPRGTA